MDLNMESKKIDDIKPTAVDTGKRVDVGGLSGQRPKTIRSRPPRHETYEVKKRPPAEPTEKPMQAVLKSEMVKPEPERKIPLYVEPLEFDDSGDFAAMLNASDDEGAVSFKMGDKVSGKIIHIGKEHVFVGLGPKVEAAMAAAELMGPDGQISVRLGQKISAYVISTNGGVTISNNVAQSGLDLAMLEEACAKRVPVEGKVLSVNKGGFEVQISEKRAFCPVGQIDRKFVEDTASFVGRTLNFLIERVEEGGRNIVVSRRALLMRDQKDQALETIKGLEVNKRYTATITRVADFGAFADIGGLEGLIPRSEISHGHIERVADVVSSGDRVEVVVLSFEINEADPIKSKLSFSLKKTKEDPYTLHWSKITEGINLEGRVVRMESFGAFVELFPGIDGLIHISELSDKRVAHPKEVLSIGDPVTVRVLSVDDQEKRISLSLKESVSRKKGSDATTHTKLERGQKASGTVSRIERYGVFLELDQGVVALLPHSEMDLPKTADLNRSYSIGDKVDVVIIDVDGQNRVRVSSLARKQMEERDSYLQFQVEHEKAAKFGTFADLLKKK
jgi:small subunit ribosomal protein S1